MRTSRGASGSERPLAPALLQLDHQAPVLHHVDPRTREPLGYLVMPDARLEPDRARLRRENVVDVRRDVLGPTKYVHWER